MVSAIASQSGGSRAAQLCALHVVDSSRGQTKTFHVHLDKITSSMRYFSTYLQRTKPGGPVDISVHCDLVIFELLLTFMEGPGDIMRALMRDLSLAIPIYISSNFLKMDGLVELCAQFIASHLPHFASTADLVALPGELFSRFAKAVPEAKLEELHELLQASNAQDSPSISSRKQHQASKLHALLSRLYKHKLEHVLQSLRTTVCRCAHCGAMYSSANAHRLSCAAGTKLQAAQASPAGKRSTGGGGGHHKADPAWNLGEHLAALRASNSSRANSAGVGSGEGVAGRAADGATEVGTGAGASWREIFWDVWGVVHVFWCHRCSSFFPAQELNMCPFHPEPPIFMSSKTTGRYPCCGSVATRGTPPDTASSSGCWGREHQVLPLLPGGPPAAVTSTTTITGDTSSSSQVGLPSSKPAPVDPPSTSPAKGRSNTPKKEMRGTAPAAAPDLSPAWQLLQSYSHLILPPAAAASPDSKGSPADSQQGLSLVQNSPLSEDNGQWGGQRNGQLGEGKRLWAWTGNGEGQGADAGTKQGADAGARGLGAVKMSARELLCEEEDGDEGEEGEGEDAGGITGSGSLPPARGSTRSNGHNHTANSSDASATCYTHAPTGSATHPHSQYQRGGAGAGQEGADGEAVVRHTLQQARQPPDSSTQPTPQIQSTGVPMSNRHAQQVRPSPGTATQPTPQIQHTSASGYAAGHGPTAVSNGVSAPDQSHGKPSCPPSAHQPHLQAQAPAPPQAGQRATSSTPTHSALAPPLAKVQASAVQPPLPVAGPAPPPELAHMSQEHLLAHLQAIIRTAAAPPSAPPQPPTAPVMTTSQPQSAAAHASHPDTGQPPGSHASTQSDAQPPLRGPMLQVPHGARNSSSLPSTQPSPPQVVSSHFDPGKWMREGCLPAHAGSQLELTPSNSHGLSHSGSQYRNRPQGGSGTAAAAAAPVNKTGAGAAGAGPQHSHGTKGGGAAGAGGAGAGGGARGADNSTWQGPVLLQSALGIQHKEERGPAGARAATTPPGVVPRGVALADAGLRTTSEECGPAARKLRLELLHEEDIARTEVLISHLLACRRPMPFPEAATLSDAPQHAQPRDPHTDVIGTGRAMANAGAARRDAWGLPLPYQSSKPSAGPVGPRGGLGLGTSDGWSGNANSSGPQSRPSSAGRGVGPPSSAGHTHGLHTSRWGGTTSGSSNTGESAGGQGGGVGLSRSSSSSNKLGHALPPRPNSAPRLRERQAAGAAGRDYKEVEVPSSYLRGSRADLRLGSGAGGALRGGVVNNHGYGSGRTGATAGSASMGFGSRPMPSILSGAEGTERGAASMKAARTLPHRPPSPSPMGGSGNTRRM